MHDGVSAAADRVPRAMLLLAVAAFASGSNLRVADPLIPKLSHDFSVPVGSAAYIVAAFTLAYGSVQLVSGPLADRAGKLRTVGVALLIAAAGSFACFFAPSLPTLIALRFVTGIGAGGIIPLALAFIADNVVYEKRQAAFGRFMGAILLGQAFGPLIGGVLSDHVSWRTVFLLLARCFCRCRRRCYWRRASIRYRPARRKLEIQSVRTLSRAADRSLGARSRIDGRHRRFSVLRWTRLSRCLSQTALRSRIRRDRADRRGFSLGGLLYSLSVQALVRRLGKKVWCAAEAACC
jgi:MFS family permease